MKGKIGKNQAGILRALNEHGQWSRLSGWLWSTASETERLLDSLVRRGLVTKTQEPRMTLGGTRTVTVYRPTEREKALAETAPRHIWHRNETVLVAPSEAVAKDLRTVVGEGPRIIVQKEVGGCAVALDDPEVRTELDDFAKGVLGKFK